MTTQPCPVCRRCGRKLKSAEAKERGMGKVCWEKSQHTEQPVLFEQKVIADALEGILNIAKQEYDDFMGEN